MSTSPDESQQWLAQNWAIAGRFVRDVTHDVNNQLGAVLAYAELLALETEGRADIRGMVDEIARAVQRASLLMDTLASLPNRDIETVQTVDLAAVIRETLMLFEREVDRGGVRLMVSLPDQPANVQGVYTRIARLVAHTLRHTFDRMSVSKDTVDLRIALRLEGDTFVLRIAGPAVGGGVEPLFEARKHAAHHHGTLTVEPGLMVIAIPRETGLA